MICWRKEIKLTVFLLSAQPSRMQWELHQDANQCTTQQLVCHHPWPKVYLVFRPENVTRFVFKQQFNLTLLKLSKMKVMNDLLWKYTTIFLWKYTTIFYENIQRSFMNTNNDLLWNYTTIFYEIIQRSFMKIYNDLLWQYTTIFYENIQRSFMNTYNDLLWLL